MVRLLLEHGADPNQSIRSDGNKSVWQLFVLLMDANVSCVQVGGTKALAGLTSAWYQSCELLIQHGARKFSRFDKNGLETTDHRILNRVFGPARADALVALMDEKEREVQQGKGSCTVM